MSIHSISKRRADRDLPPFIPSGSRHVPRQLYVVLDGDGQPRYCHEDRTTAHHWINAAIEADDDGTSDARHWVVRAYRAESVPT